MSVKCPASMEEAEKFCQRDHKVRMEGSMGSEDGMGEGSSGAVQSWIGSQASPLGSWAPSSGFLIPKQSQEQCLPLECSRRKACKILSITCDVYQVLSNYFLHSEIPVFVRRLDGQGR